MRSLLAFLFTASPLWAQDVGVGIRVREWLTRYDGVGYRYVLLDFKAREESLDFDLDGALRGPYLAVAYRF